MAVWQRFGSSFPHSVYKMAKVWASTNPSAPVLFEHKDSDVRDLDSVICTMTTHLSSDNAEHDDHATTQSDSILSNIGIA